MTLDSSALGLQGSQGYFIVMDWLQRSKSPAKSQRGGVYFHSPIFLSLADELSVIGSRAVFFFKFHFQTTALAGCQKLLCPKQYCIRITTRQGGSGSPP